MRLYTVFQPKDCHVSDSVQPSESSNRKDFVVLCHGFRIFYYYIVLNNGLLASMRGIVLVW